MVMFFGIGTRKGTINEESINTQHRHRTPGRVWERLPSTVTTSFTPLHHCLYFLGSSVRQSLQGNRRIHSYHLFFTGVEEGMKADECCEIGNKNKWKLVCA
ncbi:hypothetical protein Ccrd_010469 [Cynara cardunculus var. scolymus]|uniref:Uncharacterized protein n=1 Tax=Cynara cardunculus var. scolymus TaxID=59895 RepID=A0A103YL68_CYNCS|nr:hypothetical protein Ccrd_010469 [Cynara cardunculus var. scolymus]